MHLRVLTEHNGTFQIAIPREYVESLGWKAGQKYVIRPSDLIAGVCIILPTKVAVKQEKGKGIPTNTPDTKTS